MSSITHTTSLSAVAPPSARRLDKQRYQWGSSLLLLPAGILIAAVFVYGVGYSIYLGLTNLSLLGSASSSSTAPSAAPSRISPVSASSISSAR